MTEMYQITSPQFHRTLESGLFFKLMRWKQRLRDRVPTDQTENNSRFWRTLSEENPFFPHKYRWFQGHIYLALVEIFGEQA